MLSYAGGTNISWVWTDTDPNNWAVQDSADGVTGWMDSDSVPGSVRSDDLGESTIYHRIQGRDSLNAPVTEFSNVVFVP